VKQLLQTQPAVLFLVGQQSWTMFRRSFGRLVKSDPPIPAVPVDGPYTLLRHTVSNECRIEFSTKVQGLSYKLSTRLIITPHFSYTVNFLPQFRMSQEDWKQFAAKYAKAAQFLEHDPRMEFQNKPPAWVSAGIAKDAAAVLAELKSKFVDAYKVLEPGYYDPNSDLISVLNGLYDHGDLAWTSGKAGSAGYLSRTAGPCQFCDNKHWKFPKGCPYEKPSEKQYPVGFLEEVAQKMIQAAAG
jgi:hypothetical protein